MDIDFTMGEYDQLEEVGLMDLYEDGGYTIEQMFQDLATTDESASPPPFSLEDACWTASELAALGDAPVEWTVDRLVPPRGVTMLTGEGGLGKSFVAMEMALACASGTAFLGKFECKPGPVLMVDVENDEPLLGRRLRKCARGRGLDLDTLPLHPSKRKEARQHMHIDSLVGREWLGGLIELHKPVLVILDSFVAIHSQDENNNVAMRQVMMWLEDFAVDNNIGLVLVHHHRKRGMNNDSGQMMRGASDLRNSVVSHLAMKKLNRGRMQVEQDKCRIEEAVDNFEIEITNNEDRTETYLRYHEEAEPSIIPTKCDRAKGLVLEMLEEEETCEFGELVAHCEIEGLGHRSVRRALESLLIEGKIEKPRMGIYSLAGQDGELETE